MTCEPRRLILASTSPRRRELLALLGLDYTVVGSDFDEDSIPFDAKDPGRWTEALARGKAEAVAAHTGGDALVIGADTTVVLEAEVYGKPRDAAPWFLTNYKTDPHGLRAADSLLNLAEAMRQLGDNSRACIAMNEFAATYTAEAQGRLSGEYDKTRGGLTCS